MYENATKRLKAVQNRHNGYYDKKIKLLKHVEQGDWAYMDRVLPVKADSSDKGQEHMLLPKAQCPFEMTESDSYTVTVLRNDGRLERMYRDRAVQTPPWAIDQPISSYRRGRMKKKIAVSDTP